MSFMYLIHSHRAQVVAAYNYNYGGNYGYASMGDVDWGKRSSAYDPWASLGMADADWGWKKRNGDAAPASAVAEDEDGGKGTDDVEKKSTVGARPMYYNRYTFNKYHPAPSSASSDPVTLASRSRRPRYSRTRLIKRSYGEMG